jgi:hypothetical protein
MIPSCSHALVPSTAGDTPACACNHWHAPWLRQARVGASPAHGQAQTKPPPKATSLWHKLSAGAAPSAHAQAQAQDSLAGAGGMASAALQVVAMRRKRDVLVHLEVRLAALHKLGRLQPMGREAAAAAAAAEAAVPAFLRAVGTPTAGAGTDPDASTAAEGAAPGSPFGAAARAQPRSTSPASHASAARQHTQRFAFDDVASAVARCLFLRRSMVRVQRKAGKMVGEQGLLLSEEEAEAKAREEMRGVEQDLDNLTTSRHPAQLKIADGWKLQRSGSEKWREQELALTMDEEDKVIERRDQLSPPQSRVLVHGQGQFSEPVLRREAYRAGVGL